MFATVISFSSFVPRFSVEQLPEVHSVLFVAAVLVFVAAFLKILWSEARAPIGPYSFPWPGGSSLLAVAVNLSGLGLLSFSRYIGDAYAADTCENAGIVLTGIGILCITTVFLSATHRERLAPG